MVCLTSGGQPVIVNNAGSDPRWGGELSEGAFRTTTILAVPLVTQNGTLIGVLDVDSPHPARFDSDDQAGLEAIASAFIQTMP